MVSGTACSDDVTLQPRCFKCEGYLSDEIPPAVALALVDVQGTAASGRESPILKGYGTGHFKHTGSYPRQTEHTDPVILTLGLEII